MGVFASLDLMVFYVFYELTLVPMVVLSIMAVVAGFFEGWYGKVFWSGERIAFKHSGVVSGHRANRHSHSLCGVYT